MAGDSARVPFLENQTNENEVEMSSDEMSLTCSKDVGRMFWEESKKLWRIAGPAIFSRLAMYGMNVITQAFAGHLGDLDLAAISIATTVILGFNFGLLLGVGSALETLCGQAYGAQQYHMLGIYMQRCWIISLFVGVLGLPMYIFATPILKLMGQPDDIAELTGTVSIWFIPQHIAYIFLFPLLRYLQCQLKNSFLACISTVSLAVHVLRSWLVISKFKMGLVGAAVTLNIAWWLPVIGNFIYVVCGGCPQTWTGFSTDAFKSLWPFFKLSLASGVMTCMSLNGWEMMIPLGFFAATGVRIANDLGAGNARGAKFAVLVSITTSTMIGSVFWLIIIVFRNDFVLIFTENSAIREAVSKLALLLAFTILLNSVQPVLSGVAVGSGWQYIVAYVNIGCYYVVGVPFGMLLGWVFDLGVEGIWAGMISGTAVQTLVLAFLTYRCDWKLQAAKAIDRVKTWSSPPKNRSSRVSRNLLEVRSRKEMIALNMT